MEQIIGIIIALVSGALGGNAAGKVMPNFSLGTNGNSIAGIVGGLLGGTGIASNLLGMGGETLIGSIVTNLVGGGIGGSIAMVVIGFIMKAMGRG